MEIKKALLVLADISGYTEFVKLHTMSLLHAEKIISELMEAVIDAAGEPLQLNKFEGDAILFYAEVGESDADTACTVLGQVKTFSDAFRARSRELTGCNNLCPCDACRQAKQLQLKTIIHCGNVSIKRIRSHTELGGEAVIVVHRLLKNSIPAREYILMTKPFNEMSGGFEDGDGEERIEKCEGIGDVAVLVTYPPANSSPANNARPVPERQNVGKTLLNAVRLDAYGLARVLRLKKAPRGVGQRSHTRPRFIKFVSDGFRGLGMLLRRR